jgi:hypothetical protein
METAGFAARRFAFEELRCALVVEERPQLALF